LASFPGWKDCLSLPKGGLQVDMQNKTNWYELENYGTFGTVSAAGAYFRYAAYVAKNTATINTPKIFQ
jgi:hypothetical protein